MEKNKKNLLFLLLLLFALSFDAVAQIKDVPIVKLFEKQYYKYEVKSRESLYSICKKFNVTEAEILTMNPFIVDGLKNGETLMIPIKTKTIAGEKENITNKDDSSFKIQNGKLKVRRNIFISTDKPRITVFLPFALTSTPGANDRYVEFYEGLLLAVDSLKSLGLSFEVQAIESGEDTESINHAIITGKLDETDYCIGGTNAEQISMLAQWAKKNQRILILPFSSRIPEMENNPYLFQTNTPHPYMYEHLADYGVSQTKNANIIFLNSEVDNTDIRSTLIPKIKSKLQKKGIPYTEVANDEELIALTKVLDENRVNNIVPTPQSMSETNQLVTRLGAYLKANPQMKISLIGYPDWQAMSKSYQKRLYELNTFIYSNFYADVQKQNVRDFQIDFYRTFGQNLLNSYPKFGMMGYDIAAYFIPRMVFEKSDNLEKIPVIKPLQNDFQFSATNPISGAFNQVFYIIHYTPDNTVEVTPLE